MKTWLITGCSSGLGRGIAKAVLRRGDWAAVTARDPAELNTLAQAYPERVLPPAAGSNRPGEHGAGGA